MTEPTNLEDEAGTIPAKPPLPPPPETDPAPPDTVATPQAPAWKPEEKSPALAAFLSLWPGLGHLYVGSYNRAGMFFFGVLAVIYLLPLPASVFVCIFLWFFGIFDAYRQAQIVNLGDDEPSPQRQAQGGLMFGVFLVVLCAILLVNNFYPIDFDWLRDWWPAVGILLGLYLIASTAIDRMRKRAQREPETSYLLDE
jgi:hypothetical protein